MTDDILASGRATHEQNPQAVSAVPVGIPDADSHIDIDGKMFRQFHPLNKRIKDGTLRCIACGQIDEDGFHDAQYCPGAGGWLPFPTSSIKVSLKADSGYRCTVEGRLTLEQWVLIERIISGGGKVTREIVDQDGNMVGTAHTPVKELVHLESHTDDNGTSWLPPTAWAYFAACRARDAKAIEARSDETQGSVHESAARQGSPESDPS